MISNYKVVLLDIGDTLVHITEPFEVYTTTALKRCYSFFNTEQSEEDFISGSMEIRNNIRKGAHQTLLEESIYDYFEELEQKFGTISIDLKQLEEVYVSAELDITVVFQESKEFLQKLKNEGLRIIAATNNFSPLHVRLVLDKFGLLPYFDELYISGECGYRKPHPEFLPTLLNNYDLDLKDCMMIGDKLEMDIASSNLIGMSCAWINRSNKPNNSKFTPSFTVNNLLQLA